MHASHDSKEGGQRQSPRLQTEAWTVDFKELECEEKDDARLGMFRRRRPTTSQ